MTYVLAGSGLEPWAAAERQLRILRLILGRGMSVHAAETVVDAAMFGIGCIEGTIRKQIEERKSKCESES